MEISITQTNTISGELGKPSCSIMVDGVGNYSANITFPVFTTDVLKGTETLSIFVSTRDWNTFWTEFNSGRYLIELLKQKYNLDNLTIPSNIEDWFINK
jgi:hypothetical protein